MPKVHCYLQTRRKEWCLTQKELGNLTGSDREKIREIEHGRTRPTAHELIAFAFIFNQATPETFPSYAESVQDAVMAAASKLSDRIENDDSSKGRRKRELIRDMLARVTSCIDYV